MDKKLKDIAGSLEFGAVYTGILVISLYSLIVFSFFAEIFVLVLFILKLLELLVFVFISIFLCFCMVGFIFFVTYNQRHVNYIKKCLCDAIEITAKCKELDGFRPLPIYSAPMKRIKIQVIFNYLNASIVKNSGKEDCKNIMLQGYAPFFKKFANKRLKILYSPSMDKVLFLKANL